MGQSSVHQGFPSINKSGFHCEAFCVVKSLRLCAIPHSFNSRELNVCVCVFVSVKRAENLFIQFDFPCLIVIGDRKKGKKSFISRLCCFLFLPQLFVSNGGRKAQTKLTFSTLQPHTQVARRFISIAFRAAFRSRKQVTQLGNLFLSLLTSTERNYLAELKQYLGASSVR